MKDQSNDPSLLKEGNVLFNNALNTFYLWLYGVRLMVKDNSDSERKHVAATTISQKAGVLYMHHPIDRIAHTTACYTIHWNSGWNEK